MNESHVKLSIEEYHRYKDFYEAAKKDPTLVWESTMGILTYNGENETIKQLTQDRNELYKIIDKRDKELEKYENRSWFARVLGI
jgi:hypothetical protein